MPQSKMFPTPYKVRRAGYSAGPGAWSATQWCKIEFVAHKPDSVFDTSSVSYTHLMTFPADADIRDGVGQLAVGSLLPTWRVDDEDQIGIPDENGTHYAVGLVDNSNAYALPLGRKVKIALVTRQVPDWTGTAALLP